MQLYQITIIIYEVIFLDHISNMALLHSKTKNQQWSAPDFSLLWTDDKQYGLQDFSEKKWLAVIFTCNHCPYAIASRPVIIGLSKAYPEIWFVCINSNDPNYVEEDSYENMQKLSEQMNFWFPYLVDADQSVAKAYDAQCTPDNYLFKNTWDSFELFFHWRFNDNRQDLSQVTEKNFEDNMVKLLNNEQASEVQPPSMGCSIKWK